MPFNPDPMKLSHGSINNSPVNTGTTRHSNREISTAPWTVTSVVWVEHLKKFDEKQWSVPSVQPYGSSENEGTFVLSVGAQDQVDALNAGATLHLSVRFGTNVTETLKVVRGSPL